ncbi:polyprenyl synthetase family protein [Aureimonas mangrovi]|uniref:polyprenyl synthetase family protein n=1 Tax=Aureimonas mangrovi TaxID=2758041 RepID=UPI00163DE626|nr:polyprenyl synthetase family protein [Aureimonas mangrovi]
MNAEPTTSLDATRRRIQARLETLIPEAEPAAMTLAMREALLAPGKRLRPLMTAIVAQDLGGDPQAAVDIGCAIEMVHAASLILDDLPCMDDAELRRGEPALHRRHGEDIAVLAAVSLLSDAYGLVAAQASLDAAARVECVAILSRAVGLRGLVGGQFQDLREGQRERALSQILETNALKTGSLFRAAVEAGAIVAGAQAAREPLSDFAQELGHAFQLLDDLLDKAPDARVSGKNPGQDAGKSTVVALIGRPPAEKRIERHVAQAHIHLAAVFGPDSRLAGLVDSIVEPFRGTVLNAAPRDGEARALSPAMER